MLTPRYNDLGEASDGGLVLDEHLLTQELTPGWCHLREVGVIRRVLEEASRGQVLLVEVLRQWV